MSALNAAAALGALLAEAPEWLPAVTSWEIAEDGDSWILCGSLPDSFGEGRAAKVFGLVAGEHGVEVDDDGRTMKVLLTREDTRMQLYYFRPITGWVVPERCATCPTELGAPDVKFVRLGEGPDAPVICVACRDRMHAAWTTPAGSAPMVVNTVEGTVWTRREQTRGGEPLYAPQERPVCPAFVMATYTELAEHGIAGEADALPMPVGTGPRTSLAALLGDAKPASDSLLHQLAESVRDRLAHEHPKWEDLFCLNLTSFMGERMGPVLRRLIDAEARVAELKAELSVDRLTALFAPTQVPVGVEPPARTTDAWQQAVHHIKGTGCDVCHGRMRLPELCPEGQRLSLAAAASMFGSSSGGAR
ncbi:hypothetical protein ABZY90_19810 [Streptomyces sp. NPDC006422]|uniref:hypothetical protein n=1 Tax=unclassified Streptomyces TaxID=2593676 RepID=UPI0033BDF7F2